MNRDETLKRIEHADDESGILAALRDFVLDPANGFDPRLALALQNAADASDVPAIALELTRLRLAARTQENCAADLETVFARASVRLAELHDRTGKWKAYRARPAPESRVDEAPEASKDPSPKVDGSA